jgi:predicted CoA-binding protein
MNTESMDSLLTSAKAIAIVGVSDKADRPSNGVARYLLENSNYDLFFVNPALKELLGHPVYSSLAEVLEVTPGIDIVDVFRKIEDMPAVLDEAIAVGAGAFWMQLGLRDDALANKATAAGMQVVQDKCIKIEHKRIKQAGAI